MASRCLLMASRWLLMASRRPLGRMRRWRHGRPSVASNIMMRVWWQGALPRLHHRQSALRGATGTQAAVRAAGDPGTGSFGARLAEEAGVAQHALRHLRPIQPLVLLDAALQLGGL